MKTPKFPAMLAAAFAFFLCKAGAQNPTPVPVQVSGTVSITFTGGHETFGPDRGRPVVLVAGALGVPPEVFRKVFSGVHPAGPGSGGPTDGEARANKQVLMQGLAPYGVTDDRLNTVSNYYRYVRSRGEMWPTTPAAATATIENGAVKSITITNPGNGYSSPPQAAIEGMPDVKLAVTLSFDTDFKKNGAIKEITAGK